MNETKRIRVMLFETNVYRRLWRAWNDHCVEKRPNNPEHHAIKNMFLNEHIKGAFFFRFVVRLYAMMEEDEKKFTLGKWLDSMKQTLVIESVRKKYLALRSSKDFKRLLKNRHNQFAHNSLTAKMIAHTYGDIFKMSEILESLYDEVVADGQTNALPWTGELDRHFVHESNCPGGIENNVAELFQKLKV